MGGRDKRDEVRFGHQVRSDFLISLRAFYRYCLEYALIADLIYIIYLGTSTTHI